MVMLCLNCMLVQLLMAVFPKTSNHLGMDMISLSHVVLKHGAVRSFEMVPSLMRKCLMNFDHGNLLKCFTSLSVWFGFSSGNRSKTLGFFCYWFAIMIQGSWGWHVFQPFSQDEGILLSMFDFLGSFYLQSIVQLAH